MTNIITTKRLEPHSWDALLATFRDSSYRQLSCYAAAAATRVGAKSELNGLFDGEALIGMADVRIKTVPLTPLGIAYINYAPVTVRDGSFCAERFGRCLDALRREYVDRRGLLLRVVPTLNGGLSQQILISSLEANGLRANPQHRPRETLVLDLAQPLSAIRIGFDPKWRSDLVKAEKAGMQITRSVDLGDFDRFDRIFLELARRKEFKTSQDVQFFKSIQPHVLDQQKFVLHLAWHGDELIAGHLGSFIGDTAVYLLGAASSKGRDMRASYLLQWAAISHAQSTGNSYYDLGGINPQQNPDVFRFKRRMNGRPVTEIGSYERAPNGFTKNALQILELARSAILGRPGHERPAN